MKALVGLRIRVCRRSVFMNLKMIVMKCLLHSTLLGMLSIGVSGVAAAPWAGPKPRTPKPSPAIRPAPKRRDVTQDRHDVVQDHRDVTRDQRDVSKDRTDLSKDRRDVVHDQVDLAKERRDVTKDSHELTSDK